MSIKSLERIVSHTDLLKEGEDYGNQIRLEETLVKLVDFAKAKVKFDEFTSEDKFNLLELFINNEVTYAYIYRSLFPSNISQINENS